MKKTILFFSLLILTLNRGWAQKASHPLNASEKAYVLSKFCTEVKYNFVHFNKLKFDWDSLCKASLPLLTATKSDEEFIQELSRLCVQLQDGHTYIYPQNRPDNEEDWIRPFPMTTKRVGDQVFVTSVRNSAFAKQGVCYGCEILEIDGENVIEYANRHLRPYASSSTPQWSDHSPFMGFALTKAKGSKVSRILFRHPKGKTFTVESNRNIPWDLAPAASPFELKILDNNIGLLTIKNFYENNYRAAFDTIYEEILKTEALIIDIRDNGGGNSSHADYIIRHFSNKPVPLGRWSSRKYIAAHASWGYPQEWHIETSDPMEPIAKKTIYTKPVALLVNATTFSSAENFCVTFRGLKRGKIIGTPTGGSTGNPIQIDLGYGIGCGICTRNEWDVDGNEFIGIGILPDIEVKENADMFIKNKDIVVKTAVDELKRSKSKVPD